MENLFIDISKEALEMIETFKKAFNIRLMNVPNKLKLFENEIESTLSQRFDEVPPYLASFDNGISLREYFNMAWDSTENGTGQEITENIYLWGHGALAKIKEKYQGQEISQDYFNRLNKVAKEEYVFGVAYVRYHYWLKDELEILKTNSLTGGKKTGGKITNPVISLFCQTINASGVLPRNETESVEIYCERVCNKFGLAYDEKVRQNYSKPNSGYIGTGIDKAFEKIKELILPTIEQNISATLMEFINNRNNTNKYY